MGQFDRSEIEKIKQHPLCPEATVLSTKEELVAAITKFKNGKASGQSNILPEILKAACCEDDFLDLLFDLVLSVWQESKVPKDWVDAVLIPIPKKGDLTECDDWCAYTGEAAKTS